MDSSISTRQWHLALKSDSRFLPCTAGALESIAKAVADMQAQLVLVFGDVAYFSAEDPVAERLRAALALASPQTLVAGCSTAGEITRSGFHVGTLVVTALKLGSGSILLHSLPIETPEQSSAAGQAVSEVLSSKARESQGDLRHLWVLSPGVNVNGSALVEGLRAGFGPGPVPAISGGLAGDGGAFRQTYTLTPEGVSTRHLLGIGFVGDRLVSGSGAAGGWEPFGPSRRITRAHGNRLEVLDQEPALDVYRRYLGDYAKDLPASALLSHSRWPQVPTKA